MMPEDWEQQKARLERLLAGYPRHPELDEAAIRAALARLAVADELRDAAWALMERCIEWGYGSVQHASTWTPDSDEVLVKARAVLLKSEGTPTGHKAVTR